MSASLLARAQSRQQLFWEGHSADLAQSRIAWTLESVFFGGFGVLGVGFFGDLGVLGVSGFRAYGNLERV